MIMKQEENDLLLKDLCARIPYHIKCHIEGEDGVALPIGGHIEIDNIHAFNFIISEHKRLDFKTLEEFKPYLFPLSSMTEEQKYTCPIGYANLETFIKNESWTYFKLSPDSILRFIDWLNKNHFDYRGLISMGLAIDATNLNIYE